MYERLINVTGDPGVKEALGFLMTREIAHQKSFEKALYSIEANFPVGKLPGDARFTDTYFNMSKGASDRRGPWNEGGSWDYVDNVEMLAPVNGGDGMATVQLTEDEADAVLENQIRSKSAPDQDPLTGAELGMLSKKAS